MRAFFIPAAGEQPILGDLPRPVAGPDSILVHVKAAGLNPFDNFIASGMLAGMMPHEYPVIVGRDAAGVVVEVGDGVHGFAVGDEVVGHILAVPPIQAGTLADYAVLPAAAVSAKPEGMDWVIAAAIPLASAAALAAVDAVEPESGQTVFVNGASGGVGSFAIQILVSRGVSVIATGTDQDVDRLLGLGATAVVDYTTGDVAEQVRALRPDGVDALVNLAGFTTETIPMAAVRAGGKVSTTTMAPIEEAAAALGLTSSHVATYPTREVVAPVLTLAAEGALVVVIDSVLPFEEAPAGLATLAAGKAHGKIVVTFGD